MASHEKDKVLRLCLCSLDDRGERLGVEQSPSWIEKDFAGRRMLSKQIEPGWNDLAHLAVGIPVRSLYELSSDRIRVPIARLAFKIEKHAHMLRVSDLQGVPQFACKQHTSTILF